MSNHKKNVREKQTTTSRIILIRLLVTLGLFVILSIVFFWVSVFIVRSLNWTGSEPFYKFAFWMYTRLFLFSLLYFGLGFIGIFLFYLRKLFNYLEKIVDATAHLHASDEFTIVFPREMKDLELRMNQIKLDIRNNAQVAKEAEQRKNDLVVYLAHDLKTPLTSVIGYLTLLKDKPFIEQEVREKYLSIALTKSESLETLINEFFEITRFNFSNMVLELSKINLTRMLEQLIYEFNPLLIDKKLTCTLTCPPDLMVECDPEKIQRVFDNLLKNAINYSFIESPIQIVILPDQDALTIQFINEGNPIPEDKLSRIFEAFYRLDPARATKQGGSGLGLAISKEILELHDGSIKAYSEDHKITFELTLPL